MSFDVHPLMQDPKHIDRVIRFTIEHDVSANGIPDIPIPNNAGPRIRPLRQPRLRYTRNASASLTQYDAPVGSTASLKS